MMAPIPVLLPSPSLSDIQEDVDDDQEEGASFHSRPHVMYTNQWVSQWKEGLHVSDSRQSTRHTVCGSHPSTINGGPNVTLSLLAREVRYHIDVVEI